MRWEVGYEIWDKRLYMKWDEICDMRCDMRYEMRDKIWDVRCEMRWDMRWERYEVYALC